MSRVAKTRVDYFVAGSGYAWEFFYVVPGHRQHHGYPCHPLPEQALRWPGFRWSKRHERPDQNHLQVLITTARWATSVAQLFAKPSLLRRVLHF